MNPPRARGQARKLTAASVGALLLLGLSAVLWIQAVGARRTKEMDARIQALLEESRAVDSSRPLLRGQAVPGNAWEEYSKAFDEFDRCKPQMKLVNQFIDGKTKTDRDEVARILRDRSILVDLLRAGTRRSNASYPGQWSTAGEIQTPNLYKGAVLANVAVATASILADEGRGREAADLLLDVCRYAGDFDHNSILLVRSIGLGFRRQAIQALRDLVLAGKLGSEDLREIDRELEIVDGDVPACGPSVRNDLIMFGLEFLKPSAQRDSDLQVGLWERRRWAFSDEILAAEAIGRFQEVLLLRAAGEGKPWAEARKAYEAYRQRAMEEGNPLARSALMPLDDPDRQLRITWAQLRLLRVAVRWRLTGEIRTLDDPFGKLLLHQTMPGRLKVWSVGPDGVDDGGAGGWKTEGSGDIVLEVPT